MINEEIKKEIKTEVYANLLNAYYDKANRLYDNGLLKKSLDVCFDIILIVSYLDKNKIHLLDTDFYRVNEIIKLILEKNKDKKFLDGDEEFYYKGILEDYRYTKDDFGDYDLLSELSDF